MWHNNTPRQDSLFFHCPIQGYHISYADAQFYLGLYYEEGYGVLQDYVRATKWYKKAAKRGHLIAKNNLGLLYELGKGVPQDYQKAASLYQEAANGGIKVSQDNLNNLKRRMNKSNQSNGCFITTAVCQTFNKSDDCYELTMFRSFRDNWLREQPDGEGLISEYYDIAPKIVSKINNFAEANQIYRMDLQSKCNSSQTTKLK